MFQIPGIAVAAALLAIAASWFGLPAWTCGAILAAWIAKDALLYPFLKRAYETGAAIGAERLVGSTGVAAQALDPQGYVKVGAELWRARSASRIRAGESVSVAGVSGSEALVLIVESAAPPRGAASRESKSPVTGAPKIEA